MVTTILSRELKNKIRLEARKQDKSCKRIQDQGEREKEREKLSWPGKMSEEIEQKKCFEEEIVDAPFESNINIVVEKYLIRNFTL